MEVEQKNDSEVETPEGIFPKLPPHRTVRILFSNRYWRNIFYPCHYERYGAVRLRRYNVVDDGHSQCLVEFEDQRVAEKLLSEGFIYIDNQRIKVEPMPALGSNPANSTVANGGQSTDCDNDDDGEGRRERDAGEGETVDSNFNLIDDCLRVIFRKLQIPTLWSLANVCCRFNALAEETFRFKYKDREIRFHDMGINHYPIPLWQIENFLKKFGSSIRKFGVASREFGGFSEYHLNDVLLRINKYCPNIVSLYLCLDNHQVSDEVLPMFSRLKTLKMDVSVDGHPAAILQPNLLRQVTSLSIVTPKYEHLESCFSLQNNWQLKHLCIILEEPANPSSHFVRMICERNANIERLCLWRVDEWEDNDVMTNLLQISQLRRLRHLQLTFGCDNIVPLLEALLTNDIQLELLYIGLVRSVEKDTFDIISKFQSLHTLIFFVSYGDDEDLFSLVSQLPALTVLHINLQPHENVIGMMASIVSSGKKLSNLTVRSLDPDVIHSPNEKYNTLLSIVEQRAKPPIRLKVLIICPGFDGSKGVMDCVNIAWRPELLCLRVKYGGADYLGYLRSSGAAWKLSDLL